MNKKDFFAAASDWNLPALEDALVKRPQLAVATDRRGRTAVHLAARTRADSLSRNPEDGIAILQRLMDAGADLEAIHPIPDGDEIFPANALWYAVAHGSNRPLAAFLLNKGLSPDHCLWAVVWNKDANLCALLLEHKPSLDIAFDGETPLFYSVRLRRFEIMAQLLAAGADPNPADAQGRTPLHVAAARRYPAEVVEALLTAGADPERRDSKGHSVRDVARQKASRKVQALLAER